MKKILLFFIIFLISKIVFGQNLALDNYSVWDYLDKNLKGIHFSICDTLTEKEKSNSFFGKYLTTKKSSNKESFYLKFGSVEFSLEYSIRDTVFISNNYDIFSTESGDKKLGFVLRYSMDENFANFGAYLLDIIMLYDTKSKERYFINIDSLFESIEIPKKGHLILPSPDDITKIEFRINPSLKSSNVYSIVKVNEELEAISRLDFCNDRLISFSRILQSEPNVETIEIYPCNEAEIFKTIDFFQLKYLLLRGTGNETDCTIRINKRPIKENNKPYWLGLSRNYD